MRHSPLQFLLGLLLASMSAPAPAEDFLAVRYLGIPQASPFSPQLLLTLDNEAFLPFNLLEAMTQSTLWIDGKPHARHAPYQGTGGIPPQGQWSSCVRLDEWANLPISGTHRIALELGPYRSKEIKASWALQSAEADDDPKRRLAQVRALAKTLQPGLPKRCVENWWNIPDGGYQNVETSRYYVTPDVKVVATYHREAPPPAETHLAKPLRVYIEKRILD